MSRRSKTVCWIFFVLCCFFLLAQKLKVLWQTWLCAHHISWGYSETTKKLSDLRCGPGLWSSSAGRFIVPLRRILGDNKTSPIYLSITHSLAEPLLMHSIQNHVVPCKDTQTDAVFWPQPRGKGHFPSKTRLSSLHHSFDYRPVGLNPHLASHCATEKQKRRHSFSFCRYPHEQMSYMVEV